MERKIKSNYKISELAEEDLLAIFLTGMEKFGIKRAKQYYLAIEDVFNQLANFPDMGKSRDELFPGTLSFSAGSHIVFTEKQLTKLRLQGYYTNEWIMESILISQIFEYYLILILKLYFFINCHS